MPKNNYKLTRRGRSYPATMTAKYKNKSLSVRNARAIARMNYRTGGYEGLELKFHDSSRVDAAPGTGTGMAGGEIDPTTLNCLNSMVQGNGQSERLGRKIRMRSINVKGRIHIPSSQGDSVPSGVHQVMLALVLDKQTNAVQLNSEDVFVNPATNGGALATVFRNLEHSDRFRVLAVRKVVLHPDITSEDGGGGLSFAQAGSSKLFNIRVNLRNMQVLYTGTAGTIANIQDNSLHVLAFSNGGSPNITYNSRLRYTTT